MVPQSGVVAQPPLMVRTAGPAATVVTATTAQPLYLLRDSDFGAATKLCRPASMFKVSVRVLPIVPPTGHYTRGVRNRRGDYAACLCMLITGCGLGCLIPFCMDDAKDAHHFYRTAISVLVSILR